MNHPRRWTLLISACLLVCACAGASQPMGPATQAPSVISAPEDETGGTGQAITASDGYQLPLRSWLPPDPPHSVIVALHGFNDYSGAFKDPGSYWAGQGVAVYAYDQRGFGATQRLGVWPGAETLVADLRTALELIATRHPQVPLFLLGESMGGAVAVLLAAEQDMPNIDGLILVAPALYAERSVPRYQRIGLRILSVVMPGLRLTGEGLELQPSDNIEVLRDMWFDPLTLKDARIDTLQGLLDMMVEAADALPAIDPPALMLFGSREQIIPQPAIIETLSPLRASWSGDPFLRLAYYSDGYHMLLRDVAAETVLADVMAWMRAPDAPLPSGSDNGAWEGLLRLPVASAADAGGDARTSNRD